MARPSRDQGPPRRWLGRLLLLIFLALLVLLVLVELIPSGRAHANPPVTRAVPYDGADGGRSWTSPDNPSPFEERSRAGEPEGDMARVTTRTPRSSGPEWPTTGEKVPVGPRTNAGSSWRSTTRALGEWPVRSEAFFVPTRYGRTHVVASGDESLPPLILLHPLAVGVIVWASIIEPLSRHRRVYELT